MNHLSWWRLIAIVWPARKGSTQLLGMSIICIWLCKHLLSSFSCIKWFKLAMIMNRGSGLCTCDRYIFGKNEKGQKIKMTTPVYTETSSEPSTSRAKIQIVLPSSCKLSE
jgi:hypothetical protein